MSGAIFPYSPSVPALYVTGRPLSFIYIGVYIYKLYVCVCVYVSVCNRGKIFWIKSNQSKLHT
jgi:hypothetical protein